MAGRRVGGMEGWGRGKGGTGREKGREQRREGKGGRREGGETARQCVRDPEDRRGLKGRGEAHTRSETVHCMLSGLLDRCCAYVGLVGAESSEQDGGVARGMQLTALHAHTLSRVSFQTMLERDCATKTSIGSRPCCMCVCVVCAARGLTSSRRNRKYHQIPTVRVRACALCPMQTQETERQTQSNR
eukprot:1031956-Rhodomonas_salina.2